MPTLLGVVEDLRKTMNFMKSRARGLVPVIVEGVAVENVQIHSTNDSTIELRVYTPTDRDGPFPALI